MIRKESLDTYQSAIWKLYKWGPIWNEDNVSKHCSVSHWFLYWMLINFTSPSFSAIIIRWNLSLDNLDTVCYICLLLKGIFLIKKSLSLWHRDTFLITQNDLNETPRYHFLLCTLISSKLKLEFLISMLFDTNSIYLRINQKYALFQNYNPPGV